MRISCVRKRKETGCSSQANHRLSHTENVFISNSIPEGNKAGVFTFMQMQTRIRQLSFSRSLSCKCSAHQETKPCAKRTPNSLPEKNQTTNPFQKPGPKSTKDFYFYEPPLFSRTFSVKYITQFLLEGLEAKAP